MLFWPFKNLSSTLNNGIRHAHEDDIVFFTLSFVMLPNICVDHGDIDNSLYHKMKREKLRKSLRKDQQESGSAMRCYTTLFRMYEIRPQLHENILVYEEDLQFFKEPHKPNSHLLFRIITRHEHVNQILVPFF